MLVIDATPGQSADAAPQETSKNLVLRAAAAAGVAGDPVRVTHRYLLCRFIATTYFVSMTKSG
jgi:hypothetical protein